MWEIEPVAPSQAVSSRGACQAWREDTHNGALINGAFGAARL